MYLFRIIHLVSLECSQTQNPSQELTDQNRLCILKWLLPVCKSALKISKEKKLLTKFNIFTKFKQMNRQEMVIMNEYPQKGAQSSII